MAEGVDTMRRDLRDTVHRVWLAGLGAWFAAGRDEGTLFRDLGKKGGEGERGGGGGGERGCPVGGWGKKGGRGGGGRGRGRGPRRIRRSKAAVSRCARRRPRSWRTGTSWRRPGCSWSVWRTRGRGCGR